MTSWAPQIGGHTQIIGVLNFTPDSFSDGGRYRDVDAAVAAALALVAAGAHIVDVGGESTRPGAERVPAAVEQARILPVIGALAGAGVTVSVDTMNAGTAAAAAGAGASIVNDVSGGLADPDMYAVVATRQLGYIAMHWRGHSAGMQRLADYGDVVAEVRRELGERLEAMTGAGISPERIVLDPGLGFSKTPEHNWRLLGHLDQIASLGCPLLIGASRKRFLGPMTVTSARLFGEEPATATPAEDASARDLPTAVVSALAAMAGVWGVRVHDVSSTRSAMAVAVAWRDGGRT